MEAQTGRPLLQSPSAEALIAWCLAAFQTAVLLSILLLGLFLGGNAGSSLDDLGPLAGSTLFAMLWLTTWYCTSEGLRRLGLRRALEQPLRVLPSAQLWGGINGVFVWLMLLVATLAVTAITGEGQGSLTGFLVALILFGSVGAVVAFIIGSAVGLMFGVVELILLDLALMLTDSNGRSREAVDQP